MSTAEAAETEVKVGMVLLGCIADDLTGASDLAGELVRHGLKTMQLLTLPEGGPPDGLDAVVVALKSRSRPADEAVQTSLAALDWLRAAGCERIFFKYCSTFDSTPAGNIGPVVDALSAALGAGFSITCPAFPANRRTVYQGHLFVGDRLLNESGMESHPLNPMTDADLVRLMRAQSTSQIGLLTLDAIRGGALASKVAALRDAGIAVAIADAVDDHDLAILGAECATMPFASGASGLGAGIARALASSDAASASVEMPHQTGRRAVIAGSCSTATQGQVAAMAAVWPAFRIIADDRDDDDIVDEACAWFDAADTTVPVLVYSTAPPGERATQPGERIEAMLAEVAAHVVERGTGALIVAGGETSGAVLQRLGIESLRIGPEIDPGVPWTIGRRPGAPPLLLATKSGNFGSADIFLKAWDLLP